MLSNPLKNISVGEKLGLLSGVLLAAVFIVWYVAYRSVINLQEINNSTQVSLIAARAATLVDMMHDGLRAAVFRSIIVAETSTAQEKTNTEAELQDFSRKFVNNLDELDQLPLQQQVKEAIAHVRPDIDIFLAKAKETSALALTGQRSQALQALPDFEVIFRKLSKSLGKIGELIEGDAALVKAEGDNVANGARQNSIIVLLLSMLFASCLSWTITRVITNPMIEISTVAAKLAKGNINQQILHQSRDELGVLATAFRDLIAYIRNLADAATRISQGDLQVQVLPYSEQDVLSLSFVEMVNDLRNMNSRIQQGARTLASSIDQIMVIIQQVAASTTETATSVSETATTVEEVKQTTYVANQNAKQVADNSQRTVQVSQSGEQAVEEALIGMQHVRDQMESITRSVVKLEEQSQAIGQIITTVNELAEQSNLLAINAAIEAAKAGEAGQGFAVVAQEVKRLADQSKRATAQVHTILSDIRKATQVAVRVTEQGTQSAELGATQAIRAGESIRTLSKNISEAAQSVTKIAASSHQQLVGMDQVATAMNSIKLASTQNADGMKQMEKAIQDVHSVGQTLKELVEQYKHTTSPNGRPPSLVA